MPEYLSCSDYYNGLPDLVAFLGKKPVQVYWVHVADLDVSDPRPQPQGVVLLVPAK